MRSVARSREPPSAVAYGKSQYISRLVLTSGTESMEQKQLVFIFKIYIRDEPVRPDPTRPRRTLTGYFLASLRI